MILEKAPLLNTDRLTLHPFNGNDLHDVLEIICNDEIKKTFMLPDFPTHEDAIKLFNHFKDMSNSSKFIYGIYLQNKCIGFISEVVIENHSIEVGYVIHPNYHNQGYATEALTTSIQELFRMGYDEVKAGFFEGNIASEKVMQKSGMKKIEYTEEIEYRGNVHHCIFYALTKK